MAGWLACWGASTFISAHHQLIAIQAADESVDYWRVSDADTLGRVTEVTLGNGLRESYGFDASSQLLSTIRVLGGSDAELSSLMYTYYGNGQVHQRTLTMPEATRSRTLTYDTARRLETVQEAGPGAQDETFAFTASGRLESRTKFGVYDYDVDRPHALASVADNEFFYDARGNQETRTGPNVPGGTQTISFNRFNQPTRISFGDAEAPSRTIRYEYDGAGDRIVKRDDSGDLEVLSIGDAYERSTSRSGGAPQVQHKFRIFAGSREVAQIAYDEQTETVDTRYLHRDQQLSVLFTTNANGEISEVRDFDVFGEPIASPNWTTTISESFTGHRRETDIGLVDAGARLYDVTFGVFVSADALVVSGAGSQGFNPYAYANNDPANLIDPTGFQAQSPVEITVHPCADGLPGPCWDRMPAGTGASMGDFFGARQETSSNHDARYEQGLWELTSGVGDLGPDGYCGGAATCHTPGPQHPVGTPDAARRRRVLPRWAGQPCGGADPYHTRLPPRVKPEICHRGSYDSFMGEGGSCKRRPPERRPTAPVAMCTSSSTMWAIPFTTASRTTLLSDWASMAGSPLDHSEEWR